MPTPSDEIARRKTLRQHKLLATGLLVLAALVYLGCQWLQSRGNDASWLGYVRAAAEAGMVGGLADWFAVTALFRHPLGLKIPHTAIVKNKKDQVGVAMADFISTNFLNAELITQKVREAGIPNHIANWLSEPENAQKVSREAGQLTANVVRALDPADAEQVIQTMVLDKATAPIWGPPLGRLLEQLIADGKTEPLVEEIAGWVNTKARESEASIVAMIDERMPTWAPRFVNDLVGDKVYREIVAFTGAVAAEPNHEARQAIRRFINNLAQDLQFDGVMITRVEEWKQEIMAARAVQELPATLWAAGSASLIEAAGNPESLLRTKITELSLTWGRNLADDAELRTSLDRKITKATKFLADNYAPAVAEIISETVARWDTDEASDKIELMVGKDLQYIRVNGTVVGSLAGLAIYTVSQLLF
ncbi:DUF445 domain-containing protein [Corynebacterium epidermidicanis]|uniref:Putative membrane protein n=1 Tax=Corynebacterium epidermidicanis TaxID=1050174 RepID=A0A0G3GU38_9CORY|nr:DUF445 family protein [Corynebacterium epidermidicanis]AKK04070.1 putative membrane protein [Corynebacterium epidermidicanis]